MAGWVAAIQSSVGHRHSSGFYSQWREVEGGGREERRGYALPICYLTLSAQSHKEMSPHATQALRDLKRGAGTGATGNSF